MSALAVAAAVLFGAVTALAQAHGAMLPVAGPDVADAQPPVAGPAGDARARGQGALTDSVAAIVTLTVPSELPVGGAEGDILVLVADEAGAPVTDGITVSLSASMGTLDPEEAATVGGRVTATLRSGTIAGESLVAVRSGRAAAESGVRFAPGPPASAHVMSPAFAVAGEPAPISVSVHDAYENAVQGGLTATLTASAGVISPRVVTLTGGEATAVWWNALAGTFAVTAQCGPVVQSATTTFRPGPAALLELRLDRPDVPVDEGTTTVRARVLDANGNLVPDGRRFTFSAAMGRVTPEVVDGAGGAASATYHAGHRAGIVDVTVRSGDLVGGAKVDVRPADLALAAADLTGPRGRSADTQTYPGEPVTYTVAVTNRGMATARGVRLAVDVPELLGAELVHATASATSIDPPPDDILGPPAGEYRRSAWRLADLTSGDAVTLTLAGRVAGDHEWTGFDALLARAAVTTTTSEASLHDLHRTDAANVYAADLYVGMTLDQRASSVRPGGWLVYDIGFGNRQGQTDVRGVRITDTLGAGLRYDHWQPAIGTVLRPIGPMTPDSRELVWEFDGPFGLSQGLRLWLSIDDERMPDTVVGHEVAVGSVVYDIDPDNDRRDEAVRLGGVNLTADLKAPATVAPGEDLGFEIVVRNAVVRDTAHDVVIQAVVPQGLRVQRTHPLGIVLDGDRVQWRVEDLPPDDERRFEVVVAVPDAAPLGTFYHGKVGVESSETDSYALDNVDEVWTRVVPGIPARIDLATSATELRACSDDQSTLTVVVRDKVGHPVSDGTAVAWHASAGTLSTTESTTVDGVASTSIRAGATGGPLRVVAASGQAQASATLLLVVGPPSGVRLALHPTVLPLGDLADLEVDVFAACSNPVADGWPVDLAVDGGWFPGEQRRITLPTVAGSVSTALAADADGGPITVVARVGAVEGRAAIEAERPAVFRLYLPFGEVR